MTATPVLLRHGQSTANADASSRRSVDIAPPSMRREQRAALGAAPEWLGLTESLHDVVGRVGPLWSERILPALRVDGSAMVVAHGDSLGALCAVLDDLELGRTELVGSSPIRSIEDGFAEDDHEGWIAMPEAVRGRIQLVGDGLYFTDPARIRDGAERSYSDAVLITPNQTGTVSQTFEAVTTARELGMACMVSHRSGETSDSFIDDLVVGPGVGQIASGTPARDERVATCNRLLEIELDETDLPYGFA